MKKYNFLFILINSFLLTTAGRTHHPEETVSQVAQSTPQANLYKAANIDSKTTAKGTSFSKNECQLMQVEAALLSLEQKANEEKDHKELARLEQAKKVLQEQQQFFQKKVSTETKQKILNKEISDVDPTGEWIYIPDSSPSIAKPSSTAAPPSAAKPSPTAAPPSAARKSILVHNLEHSPQQFFTAPKIIGALIGTTIALIIGKMWVDSYAEKFADKHIMPHLLKIKFLKNLEPSTRKTILKTVISAIYVSVGVISGGCIGATFEKK